MDLTARQLGRRELARRLFIERARSGLLLECPLVPFERAGLAFLAPACLEALRAERSALGDALFQGLISEDVHRQLAAELDRRLEALEVIGRTQMSADKEEK